MAVERQHQHQAFRCLMYPSPPLDLHVSSNVNNKMRHASLRRLHFHVVCPAYEILKDPYIKAVRDAVLDNSSLAHRPSLTEENERMHIVQTPPVGFVYPAARQCQ